VLKSRTMRVLVVLILAAGILFVPLPVLSGAPSEHYFRIEASTFEFFPHTIRVKPGDRVTIELLSTDVVHGIALDGHDFELSSDPGLPAVADFTAGPPGVYRFRCSVTCGSMHPFMIGKLQVGYNETLYRASALGLLAVMAAYKGLRLR
jgi:heme/copper-type cytochrome/quinol oxidase subunit 2